MEGESQMKEKFGKNITIKVVSVFFAIVLWLFANPIKTVSINVPLKIENESYLQEKGIALKSKSIQQTVMIVAKGMGSRVESVTANDFEAKVDLSKITKPENKELTIDVFYKGKNKSNVISYDVQPKTVLIEIDKKKVKAFNVQVVTNGTLKNGYKVINSVPAPAVIQIQGYDSLIASIDTVKAFADVSKLDKDNTVKSECRVFDKSGREINEFSGQYSVDIKAEIGKEVPIKPVIKGEPADNYVEGEKTVKPATAVISGDTVILNDINEVKTEAVSIENSKENVMEYSAIKLPYGVKLVNTPGQVQVNIDIEGPLSKEIVLNREDISIINTSVDNNLKYDIQTQSITLNLIGNQKGLEAINNSIIKPNIDVGGLGEGTHKVLLKVSLPAEVKLNVQHEIEIKIEKR